MSRGSAVRRRITAGDGPARGIAARVRRFSPAWFTICMGSGIPSNLLFLMPWASTHSAFRGIGAAYLILDVALLLVFSCMICARYLIWPQIFPATLKHDTHALYIGTIPMGFITVTSALANYGQGYSLPGSLEASAVLFWIVSALALSIVCTIPFFMMTRHSHKEESLTAAWLLPFVPELTLGASGSVIAKYLTSTGQLNLALNIFIASYIQLGIGLILGFSILVLYLQRLILHHLPDGEVIISTFLPIGAAGQAGYACLNLGSVALRLFPALAERYPESETWTTLATAAPAIYAIGICGGLIMLGCCLFWLFMAVTSTLTILIQQPSKFSLGFWALTFPLGSLNYLVYALASAFDNPFLRILGTILTAVVCLIWVVIFPLTLVGFKRGTLFDAPCLKTIVAKNGDVTTVTEVQAIQSPAEAKCV